jgi:hypothetical protein
MAQDRRGQVRWQLRIVTGTSSFGPCLLLVDKLTGVLVRCPTCGDHACMPYRERESLSSAGGYYLNCRACRRKRILISDQVFAGLLREALPTTYIRVLP